MTRNFFVVGGVIKSSFRITGGTLKGAKKTHIFFERVLWFGLVNRADFLRAFKFLSLENQLTLYILYKMCMLEYLDRKFYKFWPLSCEICDRML